MLLLYPETKGLSLEEIDAVFIGSPSILGTVRYAKQRPRYGPGFVSPSKDEGVELQENKIE